MRIRIHIPLYPDDEVEAGLGGHIEVTGGTGRPLDGDEVALLLLVLLNVGLSTLEENFALGSVFLQKADKPDVD